MINTVKKHKLQHTILSAMVLQSQFVRATLVLLATRAAGVSQATARIESLTGNSGTSGHEVWFGSSREREGRERGRHWSDLSAVFDNADCYMLQLFSQSITRNSHAHAVVVTL